jgi:hypothetical protein
MRETFARGIAVIGCCLIAYGIAGIVNEFRRPRMKIHKAVEMLKNSLLTQALAVVRASDFSNDHDYSSYDGTKLPPLSGEVTDWNNSTLSYIVDLDEFRKDDPIMEQKLYAIDRYLDKNLNTNEQAVKLLDDFNDWCYLEKI